MSPRARGTAIRKAARPLKHRHRFPIALAASLGLFALECLLSPDFRERWTRGAAVPAALLLNRLTGFFRAPVCEPLALLGLAALTLSVLSGLLAALRRRKCSLLRRAPRMALRTACLLAGALVLLWLPMAAQPPRFAPIPNADALEALCGALIDALVADQAPEPFAADILREAPAAAGLPKSAVKAARAPAWLRRLCALGVYVPWTGEAIVDGTASPALLPFTAVHELMHLSGLSDEGAANLAAWHRCVAYGGAFARSARLWALRYALGLLNALDLSAGQRVLARMRDLSHRLPADAFCVVPPREPVAPGGRLTGYSALIGWLLNEQ